MTLRGLILAGIVTALASGCQGTAATTSGCEWVKPIRPTAEDVSVISDSLVNQLLAHNLAGAELCGWEP